MLYIDAKYASMLSPRLRNFKHKGNYLWNFSCPVCGDSHSNKTKARGYIYKSKEGLFVKCHNCGYGASIGNFVKYLDPNLYQEYTLEKYKENVERSTPVVKKAAPKLDIFKTSPLVTSTKESPQAPVSALSSVKRLDTLLPTHPALEYVRKRKIPVNAWSLLYFAPRFKKFVNTVVPNKFKNLDDDHPRLIIPFFDQQGKCFAFQGRAFGKEEPKYYTIKIDEDQEKIYGLDRVDRSERIYITEGPLDSLFIPNAIAVSGSSFNTPLIGALKNDATVVYDNEPRSPELTRLIKNTIDQGFSVCLWPDTVREKDINEMVMAGISPKKILTIINDNTYNGAEAQLRFVTWRKC
jgi:transcription elongation factor Elf1